MSSPPQPARASARSVALRVAVSALALAWVLHKADTVELGRLLHSANWLLIAVALLSTCACVLTQSLRWSTVLGAMGARIPFAGLLQSNLVGLFFNLFTPSNVGQDAVRVIDFRTSGESTTTGFASVLLDRLFGMSAMVVFALAAFPFAARRLPDVRLVEVVVGATAVGLLIALGLLCSPAGRPLGRLVARFAPPRVVEGLRELYGFTRQISSEPKAFIWVVVSSLAFQTLVIFTNYAIAAAVGLSTPFAVLALVVPLALLVASIPVSVNGIGLREWAYVNLWGAFGVPREQAILVSVVFFLTWVAVGLAGLAVYLTRRRVL